MMTKCVILLLEDYQTIVNDLTAAKRDALNLDLSFWQNEVIRRLDEALDLLDEEVSSYDSN